MRPVNSATACAAALLWVGLTIQVQALASSTFVADDIHKELVANVINITTSDADSGEASYNIKDCQALIDETDGEAGGKAKNGGSEQAGGGVEKLDLDKCRAMKK